MCKFRYFFRNGWLMIAFFYLKVQNDMNIFDSVVVKRVELTLAEDLLFSPPRLDN